MNYRSKSIVNAIEYNGKNLKAVQMFLEEFAPSPAHFLDGDPAVWISSRGHWVNLSRSDVIIHSARHGLDVLSNQAFLKEYEPYVAAAA